VDPYETETFPYGITLKLYMDDCAHDLDPRTEDHFCTTIVHWHRNYDLGDEFDPTDTSITCPRCDGSGDDPERFVLCDRVGVVVGAGTESAMDAELETLQRLHEDSGKYDNHHVQHANCIKCGGDGEIDVGWEAKLRAEYNIVGPILNLFMYDHSGVVLRAQEGHRNPFEPFDHGSWDSGQVGFCFLTKEAIERTGMPADSDDKIVENIVSEIDYYNDWSSGNVWGYAVEDRDGETLDSCWGFIGDYDSEYGAQSEGRNSAKHAVKAERKRRKQERIAAAKEAAEQIFWNEREVMTI
jgi:hypothetical protein